MNKYKVECISCGSRGAFVLADARYHGLRGTCPTCGSNWPES